MRLEDIVAEICAMRFENSFNPYSDRCAAFDRADAPAQRTSALIAILEAAASVELDAIWVGRDLGYRGGRRTGMALTDDVHIDAHAKRWGLSVLRPTTGNAVSERTAAVIWNILDLVAAPIFLWNVFPLHPHTAENPFTNRSHNAKERRAGKQILFELISLLRPKRLVAVGNDAASVLKSMDFACDVIKVRHPSYGGQTDFANQVSDLYKISRVIESPKLL